MAVGWMAWVRFPIGARDFCLSTASRPALGPIQPLIQWVLGALLPGVKQPGHEADHSPPYNAAVKNVVTLSPLPYTPSVAVLN
jgi:hypothetical protein